MTVTAIHIEITHLTTPTCNHFEMGKKEVNVNEIQKHYSHADFIVIIDY